MYLSFNWHKKCFSLYCPHFYIICVTVTKNLVPCNKIQSIFDSQKQEIFSLVVISRFPNINNTRTVNFILNKVFKDPTLYFLEKNKKGVLLSVPTWKKFESLFMIRTFFIGEYDPPETMHDIEIIGNVLIEFKKF